MELDNDEKKAVRDLGEAINSAIEKSPRVSGAIRRLRKMGYEPNLVIKVEIGQLEAVERGDSEEIELELTDDDLRTLRRMKIKIN